MRRAGPCVSLARRSGFSERCQAPNSARRNLISEWTVLHPGGTSGGTAAPGRCEDRCSGPRAGSPGFMQRVQRSRAMRSFPSARGSASRRDRSSSTSRSPELDVVRWLDLRQSRLANRFVELLVWDSPQADCLARLVVLGVPRTEPARFGVVVPLVCRGDMTAGGQRQRVDRAWSKSIG